MKYRHFPIIVHHAQMIGQVACPFNVYARYAAQIPRIEGLFKLYPLAAKCWRDAEVLLQEVLRSAVVPDELSMAGESIREIAEFDHQK